MTRITRHCLVAITVCLCHLLAPAQSNKIDSLKKELQTDKEDTNKVKSLNVLSWNIYLTGDYDTAQIYADQAKSLAEKISYKSGLARAYKIIGIYYYRQGKFPDALKNDSAALKINQERGYKKGIGDAYISLGNVFYTQGNYPDALQNYLAALKTQEEIGDKHSIIVVRSSLANLYWSEKDYPNALKNDSISLAIAKSIDEKSGMISCYSNMASVDFVQGNYARALENFFNALELEKGADSNEAISNTYCNIASVYFSQSNASNISPVEHDSLLAKSLRYFSIALDMIKELGDREGLAITYINIGTIYLEQHKIAEAAEYINKGLSLAKEVGSKEDTKAGYEALARTDSAQGNWQAAFEHHKLMIVYRDSLLNEEKTKSIVQQQMTYEFDKKEAITKEKTDAAAAMATAEGKRKNIIIGASIIGLLFMLVFLVFIFRSLRITRKQKQVIEIKNKETEDQKKIIEEKNKDITDSINYAQRIQQAKLPEKKEIYSSLPDCFILFKPKDIVSGDFYFFHKNNSSVFIAAADCTGHGVPGAFMSMIGSERLEDAVLQSNDTSEILQQLNKGIKTSLRQSDRNESTRDGMDIALCSVDVKNYTVKFAGANRPFWFIRKGQPIIEEIKATKKAIGGFTEDDQHFDTHEIHLQQGDTFYIFSDGYADLFGGPEGKKITTKKFKQLLLDIQEQPMSQQEKFLNDYAENWSAGTEQVDDILVIGVRL